MTGILRALQLLLWHTKDDGTVRHLGVELEFAMRIAERVDISAMPQKMIDQSQTGTLDFHAAIERNPSTGNAAECLIY